MKIGIIGCGNMGSALISGMLKAGFVMPTELMIYDISEERMNWVSAQLGPVKSGNIAELIDQSQVVIIAIKPQNIEELLNNNRDKLNNPDKVLVSIAAGVTVDKYRTYLPEARLVRVMPNTPVLVGAGASGMYFSGTFDETEKKAIVKMVESCGIVEVVSHEELLDSVTGLSGSGPAYVFSFINSLADGGVLEGLPRQVAKRLAIQTVLGAAKLAWSSLDEDIHLEELKDRVTSPGGTTAEGLLALEEGEFRSDVIKAVRAATRRARELGRR